VLCFTLETVNECTRMESKSFGYLIMIKENVDLNSITQDIRG